MPEYELKGNLRMRDTPDPEVEKREQRIPKTMMITGANRGIGLGLVKHFLEYDGIELLIATCRNPERADELNLLRSDKRLHVIGLDVDNDDSIKKVFDEVSNLVSSNGLNVLINNAGILLPYQVDGQICRKTMMKQLETNSVSVAIVTQTFLPLLKKASNSIDGDEVRIDRSAIINISSTMASIAKNDGCFSGPMTAYRMSKSALNSFSRQCFMELSKYHILVTSFCPGWVRTEMGGENADLDVNESTKTLSGNILRLDSRNNGLYFDRFLHPIPN
uniref:C-factor n=1 Tax=Caenorhabditis tropicalis TaxID=1561998 RepID=A0A1I7T749_9PELO